MTNEERRAWLAERRTGIGSSDAAGAIGFKPANGRTFHTPLAVYLDKLGELPETDSQPMKWGRLLEEVVAQAYAEETGRSLEAPASRILRHRERPWMLASLDRISVGDGDVRNVECKTASSWEADQWGVPWTDEIPELYIIQAQHQMDASGLRLTDVPVLLGGNDFRIYQVAYDPAFVAHLAALEEQFWERVQRREPPPADWTHPETPKLLELLHRPVPGREMLLEGTAATMVGAYEEQLRFLADGQKAKELLKAKIIEALGAAEFGLLPDGRRVRRRAVKVAERQQAAYEYTDFRILKPKKGGNSGKADTADFAEAG